MKNKVVYIVICILGILSALFVSLYTKNTTIPEDSIKEPFVEENIVIYSPLEGSVISSPLRVSGQARGSWFFEASAPIEVLDENGVSIGQKYITAEGDWMTTDFVPFSGEVSFVVPAGVSSGLVVFKKDNPSGESKFDESVLVPVRFR